MNKSIRDELFEIDRVYSQDYYRAIEKIQGWGLRAETKKIMDYLDAIRLAIRRSEAQTNEF